MYSAWKQEVRFLSVGPAPQMGTPSSESPPPTPQSHRTRTLKPKPTCPENATLLSRWEEEQQQQRDSGHLPLSFWPAAGAHCSGFRQKRRRRARQSRQRGEALAEKKAACPRGRRTHRTKHSEGRAERREIRGKIHPSSSPPPGARDRWSRAPP